MGKGITYTAKTPDADGLIQYSDSENAVWRELITRQKQVLPGRACRAFVEALDVLGLPEDRVPQCPEVSAVLRECTGWGVEPVPALIPLDEFFSLLANRMFPAASFIRAPEELDYLEEPDIFHEIFGHTPISRTAASPPSRRPTARPAWQRATRIGRCWRGSTGSRWSSA